MKIFYLQNVERGFVGNCLLWWAKGGQGYVTDIRDAEEFLLDEAENIVNDSQGIERPKFRIWPVEYVKERIKHTVDHQLVDYEEARREFS